MLRAVVKNLYFLHNHNRPLAYLTAIYFSVLGKAVKKRAAGGRFHRLCRPKFIFIKSFLKGRV
jgi:hypothetical protein